MGKRPRSLKEAVELAIKLVGYPCSCGKCYPDGGVAKAQEVMDLAYDLLGVTKEEAADLPDYPGV